MTDSLDGDVKASWRRFLSTYEPFRPELYRYCRHLTRSPWDAEDMAQEALLRAFTSLALVDAPPASPRAWLFRIATNQWLNRVRQGRPLEPVPGETLPREPRETREAAGTLLALLSPQERAALVLKDVFGLSLDEIAESLSTTTGAVKAALHRGRGKLTNEEPAEPTPPVAPAVLDAFCAAFEARDLERLTALLLDASVLEYPGFRIERGARAISSGTLQGTLFGCEPAGFAVTIPPRCELRSHRGHWLFLWWHEHEVHAVVRVEVQDERISRLVSYYHSPEVLEEVCRELAVPFRAHGYRPGGAA